MYDIHLKQNKNRMYIKKIKNNNNKFFLNESTKRQIRN